MSDTAHCWQCGAALALDLAEPVGRGETCDHCDTDIRACRACVHYDPALSDSCAEPSAERISDPERANFCGWYRIQAGPRDGLSQDDPAAAAKRRLEALFGKGG